METSKARYAEGVSENASTSAKPSAYAQSGVDTAAGDLAVELMKSAVGRTHGPEVLGGVGGFAGWTWIKPAFLVAFLS